MAGEGGWRIDHHLSPTGVQMLSNGHTGKQSH